MQIALLENALRRPSWGDIDVSQHAELPNLASLKVFALNENEAAPRRKELLEKWAAAVAAKTSTRSRPSRCASGSVRHRPSWVGRRARVRWNQDRYP
ncbi:MAG: hypothetical protein EB064_06170 [Betaproteobacteria bacterium]|nr:hypothetical protein [Betaproteobacteria bacterium]